MKKVRFIITTLTLISITLVNAGCALIGTALAAGAAYGIYMATKH